MITSDNSKREQREHTRTSSKDAILDCSLKKENHENCENPLYLEPNNPLDIEPPTLQKININRPCFISHSDSVEIDGKRLKPGVYYHYEEQKKSEKINVDEWVCSPLIICAITSSPDGDDFGRLLRFLDSNGKWHEWAMPMYMLKGSGDELRGELLNQGVILSPKRNLLIEYIMSTHPKRRITSTNTIGWYNNTFILPSRVIGSDDVVFQSEITGASDFSTSGSLDGWKEEIGKFCIGNIPLILSISTVLAGSLLKHVNRQQGGGIHWVGDSSIGKSTAIEIAATVWGSPDFIRSWSATSNGLEGVAANRNDTSLILDEINEAFPHEVGKIVYVLINGYGKQRAGRTGNARKIQRWRLMAVSTGEKTLENIIKETGKQINSGQVVRLLNIPANFEHGAFSNLHSFKDGRSLSDHLKSSRLKHYGHVGIAFVEKLINDKRDFPEMLDKIIRSLSEPTSKNLEKRAATTFAIIGLAGELAIEYNILPWPEGSVLEATHVSYVRWQKFQGAQQTEEQKILNAISDFIDKHGDSRFSPLLNDHNDKIIYDRAGWYKDTDNRRIFMFTSAALQEAGSGYDKDRIINTLIHHNWLADKDSDRFTKKTRIKSETKNLYYISVQERSNI